MILAEPGFEGAQRTIGWPNHPETWQVCMLGLADPNELVVLLGPQAAGHEEFGINVAIKYQDPGAPEDMAAEVDEVTFGYADTFRNMVRARPNLAMPGETAGTVARARAIVRGSDGTGHPAPSPDQSKQPTGLMCVIEMTVACFARAS